MRACGTASGTTGRTAGRHERVAGPEGFGVGRRSLALCALHLLFTNNSIDPLCLRPLLAFALGQPRWWAVAMADSGRGHWGPGEGSDMAAERRLHSTAKKLLFSTLPGANCVAGAGGQKGG